MVSKLSYYAVLSVILVCYACGDTGSGDVTDARLEPVTADAVNVPAFNMDSAYAFVRQQVDFGPRVPGTAPHDSCADYLATMLERYKLKVDVQEAEVQAFNNKTLHIKNIIGSLHPEKTNRILLCAHWDTRPFADQDTENKDKPIDGANDGGSGVGVLLEMARQFSLQQPDVGVDIIFFDAEDYGQPHDSGYEPKGDTYCLGSQFWAKNPHKQGYYAKYGILLDMVGAEGARFAREATSMYYAENIVNKVWNAAARAGYSDFFVYEKTYAITDDHAYINEYANIPTIDIVEYDPSTASYFGPYWHTHDDNMDIIDKHTLKAVGQTLLEVVYREK